MNLSIIILIVVFTVVHVQLSKMDNKHMGWIVPCLSVFFSVNSALGYLIYSSEITAAVIGKTLLIALEYNIFTVVLIVMYKLIRRSSNKKGKQKA